ncbi:MAG: nucleotidyltransferase family protein [Labilithrix sp.]|nr:nucleotidyltransferase family protein [Labilithrix sp.]MCW5813500.1 nucleotidyltransferase family protein [Labilithrix sp.]
MRVLRGDVPAWLDDVHALFVRAEVHGLAGVVDAKLRGRPELDESLRDVRLRELARALDHAAHLDLLHRIDHALVSAGIGAIALKGALLAERLYATPSSRVTSDVDLLVAEADTLAAIEALSTIGYSHDDNETERRYRREHHHLHLSHAASLPLELHFHAYRGFGSTLRSEPLLRRKERVRDFEAIGVLSASDELAYLAVHAAAHRFGRIAWLYELALLVGRMSGEEVALAARHAADAGYRRVVGFAADLLVDVLGVDPARVAPLRRLGSSRGRVARALVREPAHPRMRSLSRFVYSLALCDDPASTVRYARRAVLGYITARSA